MEISEGISKNNLEVKEEEAGADPQLSEGTDEGDKHSGDNKEEEEVAGGGADHDDDHETERQSVIDSLRGLIGKSVSEDESKLIFNEYDLDGDSVLQRDDLHRFLLDLAQAFNYPPCVPNESVEKVLAELVLNVESTGTVSWIEFKSFFVYLQQSPLQHLYEVMTSVFSRHDLSNAVLIRFKFVIENEAEIKEDEPAPEVEPEVDGPDISAIKEAISADFADEGEVNHVFVVYHPQTSMVEALVVFEMEQSVGHALEKDGKPIVQSPVCSVVRYNNQRFPSIPRLGTHSRTASALATGYLYGQKAIGKVKNVDEQYHISSKVSNAASKAATTAKSAAKTVDETLKLSETAKNIKSAVVEGAKEFDDKHHVSQTVTETTHEIDNKLKISENVGKAKTGLKNAANTVIANQHVQKGWGFVTGLANSVSQSVLGLQQETMEIVKEKRDTEEDDLKVNPQETPRPADHDEHQNDQLAGPPAQELMELPQLEKKPPSSS